MDRGERKEDKRKNTLLNEIFERCKIKRLEESVVRIKRIIMQFSK